MRKGIYHLVKTDCCFVYYLMCNLCPVKQNRIVLTAALKKLFRKSETHLRISHGKRI